MVPHRLRANRGHNGGVGGPGGSTVDRRQRGVAWLLVAVPAVLAVLGAWAYRWVDEDAFINFRILHNVAAGHGPVYNVGERVEADSDPLWVLTLGVVHLITPFLSLEWLSVLLGLAFTLVAFLVGGRALQRLRARRGDPRVAPVGLLVVAAIPVVWEFSTSGLETSMAFAWLAASFWLLVLAADESRLRRTAAVVMGLGMLVRPELAIASAVFVACLVAIEIHARRFGRAAGLVALAGSVPAAYELFRMGYYALLVPNTGLAKDAAGSWWSQGLTYALDLVRPYALWLPLVLGLVLVVVPARAWWSAGDRRGVALAATPMLVGLLDVLYVVHLGGDYMHGRLLLPGLFALCLPMGLAVERRSTPLLVAAAAIVAWAGLCVVGMRYEPSVPAHLGLQTTFISDERASWITATSEAHPITLADYRRALSGRAGAALSSAAAGLPEGTQRMEVITNPFAPVAWATRRPARSTLPFRLAANIPGIGVVGDLAGSKVYVFDSFSLANPIGSHVRVLHHARPGHEKLVGPAWMLGRFGPVGTPAVPPVASSRQIAAARAAVACGGLRTYLDDITAPLTVGRALGNVIASVSNTLLRFSADPVAARRQLCALVR